MEVDPPYIFTHFTFVHKTQQRGQIMHSSWQKKNNLNIRRKNLLANGMEPNKLDGIKHSKVPVEDITSFFWPIVFYPLNFRLCCANWSQFVWVYYWKNKINLDSIYKSLLKMNAKYKKIKCVQIGFSRNVLIA